MLVYSARRIAMGSSRDALRAGTKHVATPTPRMAHPVFQKQLLHDLPRAEMQTRSIDRVVDAKESGPRTELFAGRE